MQFHDGEDAMLSMDREPIFHTRWRPQAVMQFDEDEDEMLPMGREPIVHSRWRGPRAPEALAGLVPAYFSREYNTWWEKANDFPAGSVECACRHHIGLSTYEHVLEKLKHHGIEQDEDGVLCYPPAEVRGTKAFKAKMAKQDGPEVRARKRNEELRTQREFEEYEAYQAQWPPQAPKKPATELEELWHRREEEIKDEIAEKAAAKGPAPIFRARLNTSNLGQQSGQSGRGQRRSPERPVPASSRSQQTGPSGIRRRNAVAIRRPQRISGPPRTPTPEFERVEHPDYDTDDFSEGPTPVNLFGNGLRRSNAIRRPDQYSGISRSAAARPRDTAISRPVRRSPSWEDNGRRSSIQRTPPHVYSWERDYANGRRSSIQRTPPRVEVVRDNIPNLFGYDGPPRTPQSASISRRGSPSRPIADHVRQFPSNEAAAYRSHPSPPSTPTRAPARRSSRIAAGRVQKRSP
ncbi:hypothetical protein AC578_6377 [Pseudocercospora eumusae]|uniref:Uncharacterized protein n=1 Tax=Pseudocercospora eumusae TaxID=321146 RepID=A0A139H0Y7_9PEZI|nr:hypothetical protein AC578_6377 [Pseudocercospora eumusae]